MTEHLHAEIVPGCFRCDLGRDEVTSPARGGPDTDEWWAQLFLATHDAVDGVPYAAGSEYPVPHIAAFRAAAEPLILPVVQRLAVEKAAEVREQIEALARDLDSLAKAAAREAFRLRSMELPAAGTARQYAGRAYEDAATRLRALAAAAQPGDERTGE